MKKDDVRAYILKHGVCSTYVLTFAKTPAALQSVKYLKGMYAGDTSHVLTIEEQDKMFIEAVLFDRDFGLFTLKVTFTPTDFEFLDWLVGRVSEGLVKIEVKDCYTCKAVVVIESPGRVVGGTFVSRYALRLERARGPEFGQFEKLVAAAAEKYMMRIDPDGEHRFSFALLYGPDDVFMQIADEIASAMGATLDIA